MPRSGPSLTTGNRLICQARDDGGWGGAEDLVQRGLRREDLCLETAEQGQIGGQNPAQSYAFRGGQTQRHPGRFDDLG